MAELKFLIVHCADTNPNFRLSKDILEQWHMGPRDLRDKNDKFIGVRYKGKNYLSRAALPHEYLGMRPIQELYGRGWDRLGYSDLIHRNGTIENLTPYNKDDWVDPKEMTWGVSGINSFSRHVCLEGGRNEENDSEMFPFHEIFTDAQFTVLTSYLNQFLKDHPGDKIGAHYMFDNKKTCPNTDVKVFLKLAGIDLRHIHKTEPS